MCIDLSLERLLTGLKVYVYKFKRLTFEWLIKMVKVALAVDIVVMYLGTLVDVDCCFWIMICCDMLIYAVIEKPSDLN